MNEESVLLRAFRAMDDEHKVHMLVAMQAVAKDYPARAQALLRLVISNAIKHDSLGQRTGD